ncbi:O-antigen ligase family protein [Bacteroides congonensis]
MMNMLKHFFNLPFITLIIAISNVIGPMPHIGGLYPIVILGVLFYLVAKGGLSGVNSAMAFIIFTAILSTLINNPPVYFKSYQRLGLFIIMAGLFSPLFRSKRLMLFRYQMFGWMLRVCVIVAVVSFIGYPLGINYMPVSEALKRQSGAFGGITLQSMVLGPIAAVSFCYTLCLVLKVRLQKFSSYKKHFYVFLFLCVVSFLTVLLTASRGSLLAALIGGMMIFFKMFSGATGKMLRYGFVITALLMVTFPVWKSYTEGVINKQKGNIEAGGATSSRDEKWNARMYEFKQSPLWGVGYFASLPETGEDFDEVTGQIEFGTSWGAALSTLGMMGFLPLFGLFLSSWFYLYQARCDLSSDVPVMLGVLSMFMVHMLVEGYIFGAGSYLFFMVWLSVGAIDAKKRLSL